MTLHAKVVQDKFNKQAYYGAQGYAFMLTPVDYVDIVHDAYIVWFNKTKNSLFDEHRGTIARVIKNVFYNKLTRKQFMYRGVVYVKSYVSKDDLEDDMVKFDFTELHDPEEELIYNEMKEQLVSKLNGAEKKVYSYLKDGYKQIEIAKELGVSANNVNIRAKGINKKLQQVIK